MKIDDMNIYLIAFGANMGDPIATLRSAFEEVTGQWTCWAASSLYRTAPVGGVEQDDFINAAAVFATDSSPHEVLSELQRVENQFGRTREVHWGPRTLDLDIIAAWHNGKPIALDSSDLTIPHPRAVDRSFVLVPWSELELPEELYALPTVNDIRELPAAHEILERLDQKLEA